MRRLIGLLLVLGCGAPTPRQGAMDATLPLDAGADAPPRDAWVGPSPACVVADVAGPIDVVPDPPVAGASLTVRASNATALTNVALRACAPDGLHAGTFTSVTGAYTWSFALSALPPGETQLIFAADPNATVIATRRVHVGDAIDAGMVLDAGSPPLPCGLPAGALIDGTFEAGLVPTAGAPDGLPPTWQIRAPITASACGPGHLSIVPSTPACGGHALMIDAMGTWDCTAIQSFTDYGTITPGTTYRIGAHVRAEGQNNPAAWFVIGLQWLDANDLVFGDEKNPRPLANDYDWTDVSWELVAPPNAHRAVVWLSGHYPGRVSYDDVTIAPVP